MFSLTRMFIGLAIYMLYLFAIIFLVAPRNITLFIILLFAGVGGLLLSIYSGWLTTPANYRRIMQRGIDADVKILSLSDTGMTINNSPYVKLRLRVQPPDRPAYEANVRMLVSRLSIPSVGDTIRVKFDPDKPQDIIVP